MKQIDAQSSTHFEPIIGLGEAHAEIFCCWRLSGSLHIFLHTFTEAAL